MDQFNEYEYEGEEEGGDYDEGGGYDEEGGQEFKATFEQEVAAGSGQHAAECGPHIPYEKGTAEFRKAISELSTTERFKLEIERVSKKMNDDDILKLSVDDRNGMCNAVDRLSMLNLNDRYLNVTAYVLGYWFTNGGTRKIINDKRWNEIEQIIRNRSLEDTSVFPADVIRYSRMWERMV